MRFLLAAHGSGVASRACSSGLVNSAPNRDALTVSRQIRRSYSRGRGSPDPPPAGDRGPGVSSAYGRGSAAWAKWGGSPSSSSAEPIVPLPQPPPAVPPPTIQQQRQPPRPPSATATMTAGSGSEIDIRRQGERAAAILSGMQADPGRVSAAVARALSPSTGGLAALSGHGLASLLATSCLVGNFDPSLFTSALSPPILRAKTFLPEDQCLLAHVDVALKLRAAGSIKPLPPDVSLACMALYNASVTELQGVYDPVALALRRMGAPLTYRSHDPATGYLMWLTLPANAAAAVDAAAAGTASDGPAGSGSFVRGVPVSSIPTGPSGLRHRRVGGVTSAGALSGIGRWALEVDGPWSVIPGTGQPSLASRLWQSNCHATGLRVARITTEEREKFLGPSAHRSIDAFRRQEGGGSVSGERSDAESLPDLLRVIMRDMALQ